LLNQHSDEKEEPISLDLRPLNSIKKWK
jgi:hypothetical protein